MANSGVNFAAFLSNAAICPTTIIITAFIRCKRWHIDILAAFILRKHR
ncbi:hypothetical protein CCACVL1_07501 [Corchorus capsularis]|uniref:Uncharacterized protein n=1 Tax=Corchorus capsularis TaxID=210143 RepID=A0A1R3J5T9_COCAP|nr:hypothetical protein CCACVL1_07501 [Corchorus capsularis]